jgi:DNA polymerase III, delta subunit, C terminal
MLTALPQLRERSAAELSALAQKIGPTADAALAVMMGWYRDALGLSLGVDQSPRRNPDAAIPLRALAAAQPPPTLLRALEIVCATVTDVGRNANRQLALETMLYDIRDLERGTPHD